MRKETRAKRRFIIWSMVVIILLTAALIGPNFITHDIYEVDLYNVTAAPSREYPFGTDYLGRCILCRLIAGAARSIYSAFAVVIITFIVGTVIGTLCGYIGGTFDMIVMRITDAVQAFPSMVFTIAIAAMMGSGLGNCILAMSAVGWAGYCRIARSRVMSVKEAPYVDAARISGMGKAKILFSTVLPNSLTSLVVYASMHVGNAILSFSGLSYLGLGTAPPFPEWGSMLNSGRATLQQAPWTVIYPGLAIMLIVIVMGIYGDSINKYMDSKNNAKGL